MLNFTRMLREYIFNAKCIILFLLITCTALCELSAGNIKGKVYENGNNTPLEFVNIAILRSDSSLITGTVSDDKGEYMIASIEEGTYLVRASLVGYSTYYKSIIIRSDPNEENIAMELSDMKLNEIVITSSTPTFESKAGTIIANVSLSNLKSVGTANDVIQRMPGVAFEQDNISIFGKGTPIIYVNNRKVNHQSELDRLLSEDISTVELINSPGAKYNAEGRAVLIIKTKKKQDGLAVLINEKLSMGTRLGDNEDVNISYTKNAVSMFASFYHSFRNVKTDDYTVYSVKNNDIRDHHLQIVDRYPRNEYTSTVGIDWSINANHSIGVQYEYSMTYAPRATSQTNDMDFQNGFVIDSIHTYGLTRDKPRQSLVNAFHRAKLSERVSTQLDLDFFKNQSDRRSYNTESSSTNSFEANIKSASDYNLWAGKLALEYKSSFGEFEIGGEFNYIKGNGSIIGENIPQEDNLYSSKEQKVAAFINYSNTFNGFSIKTGLRYELNHEESTDEVTHQKQVDKKFNGWYPNLSISKEIDQVQLDFLLSKKVARPSIVQLYNNTSYINQYLIQQGNPYLVNTDIYDIELEAKYKMLYFSLNYSYEKNPITFYSQPQDNSDLIITTVANYNKYQRINALLNFNYKLGFWKPNYTISASKPFFSAIYNNENINYNRLSYSFRAYNDVTLPLDFLLSVNFNYMTRFQYMLIDVEHYQRLDLGIRKSFLNNQLKLNLEVLDVFNWMKQSNSTQINNLTLTQEKKRESRFLVFTIGYQLNNYKKKYGGANVSKDQINRF